MTNLLKIIKKGFQCILFLFTYPAMLVHSFCNWLLALEPGGLFTLGLLVWSIYSGWKDVHDGANWIMCFLKYGAIFMFIGGIVGPTIDVSLAFVAELFEPATRLNRKMKYEILGQQQTGKRMEDVIRAAEKSTEPGPKTSFFQRRMAQDNEYSQRQQEEEKRRQEYEAKCRAYEEYKRQMREREQEEQRQREQREREQREQQQRAYQQQTSAASQAYQSALNMFMLDEGYTLEQLKKQRNRLLKSFHPDEGETENNAYAQKINVAFDLLKARIS